MDKIKIHELAKKLGVENQKVLDIANTNDELWVKFTTAPIDYSYAIARTVGIKGGVNESAKCEHSL